MSDHLQARGGQVTARSTPRSEPGQKGRVMIRCAESGEGVPTGLSIDIASWRAGSLSEQTLKCPHCGKEHTWSAKDAWIEEVY
jgi:hypothetical protein